MSSNLIAANRLLDGASVWLNASGEWVADMAQALVVEPSGQTDLLARAREGEHGNVVVDVREVALEARPDSLAVPVESRERMRAAGPSVRPCLLRAGAPKGATGPLPSDLFSSPDAGIYRL